MNHSAAISVTAPVGQAFDRMKRMLFQPFDIGKWFVIGFCAWLATLGDSGGSFNFKIVLAMAIGLAVLTAIVATCCLAGCLMGLPYLGAVVMLPVLVFERSYSIYYLAQFGPSYCVFPAPSPFPIGLPP